MKTTNLRVIAAVAGGRRAGAESSMLKIRGAPNSPGNSVADAPALWARTRCLHRRSAVRRLCRRTVGPKEAATAAANYFNYRKLSIFGSSDEIQKNIISENDLGL